jgi:ribosome modulation factor
MIRFVDRFSSSGLANSAADCLAEHGLDVQVAFKPRHIGDHLPFIVEVQHDNAAELVVSRMYSHPSFSEGFSARLNGADILSCPYISEIDELRFTDWLEGYRAAERCLETFESQQGVGMISVGGEG